MRSMQEEHRLNHAHTYKSDDVDDTCTAERPSDGCKLSSSHSDYTGMPKPKGVQVDEHNQ